MSVSVQERIPNILRYILASDQPDREIPCREGIVLEDVKSSMNSDWEFIDLTSDFDPGPLTQRLRLSESFLGLTRQGYGAIGAFVAGRIAHHFPDGLKLSNRTIINCFSINHGRRPLVDPFGDGLTYTTSSVAPEWYVVRSPVGACFVCERSEASVYLEGENLWVFPSEKIVLYVNNGLSLEFVRDYICSFIFSMCDRHEAIRNYVVSDSQRNIALCDWPCPHLAHNFWNVQTGWFNTLRSCDLEKVSHLLERRSQNYFGLLNDLYDDLVDGKTVHSIESDDGILDVLIKNNLLLLTVKDENIHNDLVNRIVEHAQRSVSSEFAAAFKSFREECYPLVMFTIRLDNRSWVEQIDGAVSLFLELRKKFPNMGLMLDGMSRNSLKGWTTDWMSLDAELSVAEQIASKLRGHVPVIFSVGKEFFESLLMVHEIDYFIAPIGSGMTFSKWISRKPGVGFSNTTALNETKICYPLKVWDHYTEGNYKPVYVHSSKVRDAESRRGTVTRANFSLDWRDIYEVAADHMDALFASAHSRFVAATVPATKQQGSEFRSHLPQESKGSVRILPAGFYDIYETLSKLCPRDLISASKRRFGRALDGGCVLVNCVDGNTTLMSYGSSAEISFEVDFAGIARKVYLFDRAEQVHAELPNNLVCVAEGFLNCAGGAEDLFLIDQQLDRLALRNCPDLVLKLDVEGAEIDIFAHMSVRTLACFSQIVMELHWLNRVSDPNFRKSVNAALDNINKLFTLVHVHSNNGLPIEIVEGVPVPPVLELTYIRSDLQETEPSKTVYPTLLDYPNDNFKAGNLLHFFPFLPGSEEITKSRTFRESLRSASRGSN